MLKLRVISSVIGIIALILAILGPSQIFYAAVFLLTIIGLNEFYNVMKVTSNSLKIVGFASSVPLLFFYNQPDVLSFTLYLLVLTCFTLVILDYGKKTAQDITMSITAAIFVSFLFSHLVKVYNFENGKILIWLIFLGAFATDTFAYFVGMNFGKHKLTPVSPKKSVEGSIGGLIGSIVVISIYGYIINTNFNINIPLYNYLIIGLIAGTVSQIGDLSASLFKRYAEVKDYGNIMPGHGGVLDRFDSTLFIAPAVYFYLHFALNLI